MCVWTHHDTNIVLLYIYCFVFIFLLGQNLVRDPFSWDITGRNIMMLIIQGFVFFFFTVLIEYRFFLPKRFASCLSLWYFRSVLYEVWSCCDYRATAADYHTSESHLFLETCNEWLKPRQTLLTNNFKEIILIYLLPSPISMLPGVKKMLTDFRENFFFFFWEGGKFELTW